MLLYYNWMNLINFTLYLFWFLKRLQAPTPIFPIYSYLITRGGGGAGKPFNSLEVSFLRTFFIYISKIVRKKCSPVIHLELTFSDRTHIIFSKKAKNISFISVQDYNPANSFLLLQQFRYISFIWIVRHISQWSLTCVLRL